MFLTFTTEHHAFHIFLFLESDHAQIASLRDNGHLLLCITLHNLVRHTGLPCYTLYTITTIIIVNSLIALGVKSSLGRGLCY